MFVARLFFQHPASVGETYREHMRVALGFAGPLAKAALAAGVHAFLPFLFTTTASRTVKQLNDRMARRCATCAAGPAHRPDLFGLPGPVLDRAAAEADNRTMRLQSDPAG
jgi:hypothetical protein